MTTEIKDFNGNRLEVGDKVGLPVITDAVFELVNDEERGLCLCTSFLGHLSYVDINEAKIYGMCKL